MQYVNRAYSDLNFSNINASYDLRLLYGDTNNDSKISADEYVNFDFSSIDINENDEYQDFKFLTFKPDQNTLYVYFASKFKLDNSSMINMIYSDSTELNQDKTAYVENIKNVNLDTVNYYLYGDTYFYKSKVNNFSLAYQNGGNVRVLLYRFQHITPEGTTTYEASKETELIYPVGTDWTAGNFYYFENNTYTYKAKLSMALGVIDAESYYPTVFAFGIKGNEAKETTVNSAREITYMFVEFDDRLSLDELVSVNVEFNKIEYDYIRYAPVSSQTEWAFGFFDDEDNEFGDVYAGLYESQEYGSLENGLSLNGKTTDLASYDEDVNIFTASGENEVKNLTYDDFERLSDNSGSIEVMGGGVTSEMTVTNYNPDFTNIYNGFYNVSLMNNGKPYKKTIESDYSEGEYTYTQINNESTYWEHTPYKRTYDFKPIINLSTYQSDLSEDKYKLAKDFIYNSTLELSDSSFEPNFAVLIDGAPNEENNDESTRTVSTEDSIDVYSEVSNVSYQGGYKYLTKRVSHCHEVYNAIILTATARQDNGGMFTFNCLGDPAYTKYISFVGYPAPSIFDLVMNDVGNWLSDLGENLKNNPLVQAILIVIGIILLIIILSLIVRFIRWIVRQFKK